MAVSPDARRWPSRADLWLMAADGSDQCLLVADYEIIHGIGPEWALLGWVGNDAAYLAERIVEFTS
jgi:hypothetical protein